MAKWYQKLGGAVASVARTVTRNPIVGAASSFIPGGGLILKAGGLALTAGAAVSTVSSLFGGGGSISGLPGLPSLNAGPMGPTPGPGGGMVDPNAGKRSIFRDDPNVHAALRPYAIDDRFLKQIYRAPRGYVVLRDPTGDAYAIPKWLAKAYGMWKPAKKPPISVRQWQGMKHARSTMKALQKVERVGRQLARFGGGGASRRPSTSYQVITGGKGDDVIVAPPKRAFISSRKAA